MSADARPRHTPIDGVSSRVERLKAIGRAQVKCTPRGLCQEMGVDNVPVGRMERRLSGFIGFPPLRPPARAHSLLVQSVRVASPRRVLRSCHVHGPGSFQAQRLSERRRRTCQEEPFVSELRWSGRVSVEGAALYQPRVQLLSGRVVARKGATPGMATHDSKALKVRPTESRRSVRFCP